MPDFLTKLIERSRGTTEAAQPLLAPALSPAPALGDELAPQLNLPDETIEFQPPALSMRQAAPQSELSPDQRRQHSQSFTSQSHTDIVSSEIEEVNPPPPARERTRLTGKSARRFGTEDKTVSNTSAMSESHAEPQPTPPSSWPVAFEQKTLLPLQVPSSASPRNQPQDNSATAQSVPLLTPPALSAPHGQPPTAAATKDERTSATQSLVETRGRPQVVASPVSLDAAQRGRQLSNAEQTNKKEAADSGPTIRVSIGRVEVRAVVPQPQTPPPQPVSRPAPRISLDEYLRAQNGGRR